MSKPIVILVTKHGRRVYRQFYPQHPEGTRAERRAEIAGARLKPARDRRDAIAKNHTFQGECRRIAMLERGEKAHKRAVARRARAEQPVKRSLVSRIFS